MDSRCVAPRRREDDVERDSRVVEQIVDDESVEHAVDPRVVAPVGLPACAFVREARALRVPHGALAGHYAGVGADASVGAGLGANVLVGGTGRAFSLQPLSIEGETGLNIAAGVTTVTLTAAAP